MGVAWFPQVPLEDNLGQIIQDNSHLGLCLPERILGWPSRPPAPLSPEDAWGPGGSDLEENGGGGQGVNWAQGPVWAICILLEMMPAGPCQGHSRVLLGQVILPCGQAG